MKVMVLGSAGQIGTALCKKLREDRSVTVVKWDIRDKPTMHDLTLGALGHTLYLAMSEVDYVYFLAEDSSHDPMKRLDANLRIMINVFQALDATKKPFVFTTFPLSDVPGHFRNLEKAVGEHYTSQHKGDIYKFTSEQICDEIGKARIIEDLVALLPK